uniref:SFRICE_002730 n=1 Tax=Spodoptera frugiperda TaxID=7108 RepID=A0A2H1V668_SPOFR
MLNYVASAPQPPRLTIDCADERVSYGSKYRSSDYEGNSHLDVDSFCNLIHDVFPKSIQGGKFLLIEPEDQIGYSDTQVPISIAPPPDFMANLRRIPKLRIPTFNGPRLEERPGPFSPPRMLPTSVMRIDSSAERMERFKKGVQKMLHVVKVLGQIDHYFSERMRIIVDKLTKTFGE